MSEAEASPDFCPQPPAPPRRTKAIPGFRHATRPRPAVDSLLSATLSLTCLPERREPLQEIVLPNGEIGVYSAVLGLTAYVAERTPPSASRESWALTMRWHDPATAADIPDYDQARARADAAEHEARAERTRADAERSRAEAAQRRIAELEEDLRRLRDGP